MVFFVGFRVYLHLSFLDIPTFFVSCVKIFFSVFASRGHNLTTISVSPHLFYSHCIISDISNTYVVGFVVTDDSRYLRYLNESFMVTYTMYTCRGIHVVKAINRFIREWAPAFFEYYYIRIPRLPTPIKFVCHYIQNEFFLSHHRVYLLNK